LGLFASRNKPPFPSYEVSPLLNQCWLLLFPKKLRVTLRILLFLIIAVFFSFRRGALLLVCISLAKYVLRELSFDIKVFHPSHHLLAQRYCSNSSSFLPILQSLCNDLTSNIGLMNLRQVSSVLLLCSSSVLRSRCTDVPLFKPQISSPSRFIF